MFCFFVVSSSSCRSIISLVLQYILKKIHRSTVSSRITKLLIIKIYWKNHFHKQTSQQQRVRANVC